jgi:hypothetical protein
MWKFLFLLKRITKEAGQTSVHPETPEDASWRFQFINEQFAAKSRKSRDCAEAYFTYVAQEIPKIDVEIAGKGHLLMERN